MVYEIKEIKDLFQIPSERMPDMFLEMMIRFIQMKKAQEETGANIDIVSFGWVDDGKMDFDVSIEVRSPA